MNNLNTHEEPNKEKLREQILEEIRRNPLLQDENILVEIEGHEIVLYGDVDFQDKKWLAQDIANSMSNTAHIRNEIKVVDTKTYW